MTKTYIMLKIKSAASASGFAYYVTQDNSKARYPLPYGRASTKGKGDALLAKANQEETERQETMAANKADRKARNADGLREMTEQIHKVGCILYTSWGYEQTNVEFYQVIGTHGKRGVIIRQIAKVHTDDTGPYSGRCKAAPGEFVGEPMRKTITAGGIRMASYSNAWPADHGKSYHYSWGY